MNHKRQWRRRQIVLGAALGLVDACRRSGTAESQPVVHFTRIPKADEGGGGKNDIVVGTVKGARPEERIVLYARNRSWWVQPLENEPFTSVGVNGKWVNATHLGTEYAALLVKPGFAPPTNIDSLPAPGGLVSAVTVEKGAAVSPSPTLFFSGYEWRIRTDPSTRGNTRSLYLANNTQVDKSGALHLQVCRTAGGQWSCAEVSLTRSLGYGTYSFSVRDVAHFEPPVVFGMFTWDYAGAYKNSREMDIEVSRWGGAANKNTQYVIQPFNVANNVFRFSTPRGRVRHSLSWQPGRAVFRSETAAGSVFAHHEFTSGVPAPGLESVRMNLYVYEGGEARLQNPTEVVIDRFEFLP